MKTIPKLTIITPSYNQSQFLEKTIKSILDQGYPNLEYIVIDGGSTDGSVDIIKKYEDQLTYWVSEPDLGQANAINKGLRMASGEWVGWQNSDDVYYDNAFNIFASTIEKAHHKSIIIGNINLIDNKDNVIRDIKYVKPTHRSMLAEGMVMANQAALWKREVHHDIGFLDETLHCSFDYDWFLRLFKNYEASNVNQILGAFRLHDASKTSVNTHQFSEENLRIVQGNVLPVWMRRVYQLRRLLLLLIQGNFLYVTRGLYKRFFNTVDGIN